METTPDGQSGAKRLFAAVVSVWCAPCREWHQVEIRTDNPVWTEAVAERLGEALSARNTRSVEINFVALADDDAALPF